MTTKHAHRSRRRVVVAMLAIAAAAGVTFVVRRADDEPTVDATADAASILKTAEVSSGDLTTSERVDGTVVHVDTLDVVHRIEGQNGVTSSPQSPTSEANGAPRPQGLRGLGSAAVEIAPEEDPPTDSSVPDTSTPDSTTPDTSVPDTTTPDTTPPETTTPGNTTPGTTTPARPSAPGGGGSAPSGRPTASGSGGATGGNGTTVETATQTITSVVPEGTTVEVGGVLYTVDSAPVVALRGVLPAWRTMSRDEDPGDDIGQLEENLVALGYDPDGEVLVDGEFDRATEAMVERWQTGLGLEPTGEVTLGSVVFVPSDTTVTSVEVAVGDEIEDGDVLLKLAGARLEVVIDVPAGAEALFTPGATVQLGSDATGTVSQLRSIERDDEVVVQAVIVPGSGFDEPAGTTAKVTVDRVEATDVLLVPAEALLSRLDGSYSLQVQLPDGSASFVTVEVVGVSGSQAGVRGEGIGAGSVVLLPS